MMTRRIFILAVESSRLLLNSKSKNFPNDLANNSNQVGKNLLFSTGGSVTYTWTIYANSFRVGDYILDYINSIKEI